MFIGAVSAFGDQPLPPLVTGLFIECLTLLVTVYGKTQRIGIFEITAQDRFARMQGQVRDVIAFEIQQVENIEINLDVAVACHVRHP